MALADILAEMEKQTKLLDHISDQMQGLWQGLGDQLDRIEAHLAKLADDGDDEV